VDREAAINHAVIKGPQTAKLFMSDPTDKKTPKTQPSLSGGPPRPPKKTAKGLADDDESPDPRQQLENLKRRVLEVQRKRK
jgi:hypothetical protein